MFSGSAPALANISAREKAYGEKTRPQGLKPGDCLQLFAALKRRSSTQAPAFHASAGIPYKRPASHAKAVLQGRLDKPSFPEGLPNTLDAATEI
jgi:hypothetical protein